MIYWIIHIAVLGVLSYTAFRFLKSDLPAFVFWLGLVLKLAAGIVLGYIFLEYNEKVDTFSFFESAKAGLNLADQPRSQFFIVLLRPLIRITGESYWITSLWLSFISYIACSYATVTFSAVYPILKNIFAACLLFIPSVVFWSSGVMKDALTFGATAALASIVVKYYKQSKISLGDFIVLMLSTFLLYKLKHYLLITSLLFIGSLIASVVLKKIETKWKWPLAALVFIAAFSSTQFIHPYLKINRLAWTLYVNNQIINQKTNENQLDIQIEDDTWPAVMKEVPKALYAGLFRPGINDQTPAWGWIHKIENLTLTVLLFLSLLLWVKLKPDIDWPLFIAASMCMLLLAILLPLSTPNLGSLVRYKNAYMPFLFLFATILPYQYLTSQSNE